MGRRKHTFEPGGPCTRCGMPNPEFVSYRPSTPLNSAWVSYSPSPSARWCPTNPYRTRIAQALLRATGTRFHTLGRPLSTLDPYRITKRDFGELVELLVLRYMDPGTAVKMKDGTTYYAASHIYFVDRRIHKPPPGPIEGLLNAVYKDEQMCPFLADALEEAGFAHAEVLAALRIA